MIPLILSHETALAYWSRAAALTGSDPASRASVPALPEPQRLPATACAEVLAATRHSVSAPLVERALGTNALAGLPEPLELLVGDRADCHRGKRAVIHYLGTELPDGALVELRGRESRLLGGVVRLYAVAPELCFVQLAPRMSFTELVELGFELCGTYAVASESEYGMASRAVLVEPDRLRTFCDGLERVHGAKPARRAARHVLAGSASPRETHLAMFATLPRGYGGWALPKPLLNHAIELSDAAARVYGRPTCRPDLYWPEIGTVIEFDSELWHSGERARGNDRRKGNAYELMGLDHFAIDEGQMQNLLVLQDLLGGIERAFGLRRRPLTEDQELARKKLVGTLLSRERSLRR